ncbi:hypothetical protein ABZ714_19155 [Streptomyces sp. NPDC006798]|uniref:hypothetical protein n=1 Tax=Streptomyces sp. NPDC006798 TaxID=3155462 RepID=UPI0033DCC60A
MAALLRGWCAVLLLTPYDVGREPGDKYPAGCASRLTTDRGTADDGVRRGDFCADERDWPEALAVRGLSVPVSVIGVALFTSGQVSLRLSAHAQALRFMDRRAEEEREKKAERENEQA